MFYKSETDKDGKNRIVVTNLKSYNLKDTFECGQCFRYELIKEDADCVEFITVIGEEIINVAQRKTGELIFYDLSEEDFLNTAVPYFSLEEDYESIHKDIIGHTDSAWLIRAAEFAKGIAILRQDPWEALLSFIISQNNNIPRIKKIIKRICAEYGVNICLQNSIKTCPLNKITEQPSDEICKSCGICYTFPKAQDITKEPEKLLLANPGFRYKYLCDAAKKVESGEINLEKILNENSYEYTKEHLIKINGVGEKVASCVALFGFHNLEAFPIDVWMKRAIDKYFDGNLRHESLGKYAGVAQQYIFHYIRNTEAEIKN